MRKRKIRYAVVGLGHIAQTAVLPAFQHAKENSELVALVSEDAEKLGKLSKKYQVERPCHYDDFEALLQSGAVDAVYICTPNTCHRFFVELAAAYGVHILCEKPLAAGEHDAYAMVELAERFDVKLMTAYRLHFDEANLKVIELAESGKLGDLKIFNSTFTFQVKDKNNIRLRREMGGGPLLDIGTYCINAARYLFRAEPIQVTGVSVSSRDPRFDEVDETFSAILRFPEDRIANFTVSFGASACSDYDLVGTKARVHLKNAYEYSTSRKLTVIKDEKKISSTTYPKRDQFAAELIYFSNCILNDEMPEPSGKEGLIDVQIIDALQESARLGRSVYLDPISKSSRPEPQQRISRPAVSKPPKTIHAASPSGG